MDRPIEASPYFKNRLSLRSGNATLELAVGHTLFSTAAVDAGSRRLLKSLADIEQPASVLDLGCGYGPLGLALKARFPDTNLHMVDRDALAVRFARANARDNGMSESSVYGSVGYGAVDQRFDLLVSNVPGKAGDPVIKDLIIQARHALEPSGRAAIVVVSPLADLVATALISGNARQLLRIDGNNHSVFHFDFAEAAAEEPARPWADVYVRDTRAFSSGEMVWNAATVWGVPEFDSLTHSTKLAIDQLDRLSSTPDRILVFSPGQGHLAVAAALRWNPGHITLVSRDLLALQASEHNLRENNYPGSIAAVHSADLASVDSRFDLVCGFLEEKVPQAVQEAVLDQASNALDAPGSLLVAGTSTAVTRLTDRSKAGDLGLVHRSRKHGHSAALLRTSTRRNNSATPRNME